MSSQLPVPRGADLPADFGFGPQGDGDIVPAHLAKRISRHIALGVAVALLFVVGLGVWAALSPVAGAVPAMGSVKVENNRKTIKHLESGIVRRILVREGDHVRAGQLLMTFDDSQSRAILDTLSSSSDSLTAERARFEAEARGASTLAFPPELLARRSDPQVSALLASQEALFVARRDALRTQMDVGSQRVAELGSQIDGTKAQVSSIDSQLAINTDELDGLQQLYRGGYAPKTRVLALQREEASLKGNRGEQISGIARAQQTIGETRISVLSTRQARIAEAAQGLEQINDKLADIQPRLAAARDLVAHTQVFAPVDGYVLNLSQFTEGGVAGAGEPLMDIVPAGAPLVIQVQVRPQDVHYIRPGQRALITLTAYNSRTTPRIFAEVVSVAADQTMPNGSSAAAESAMPGRTPFFLVEMRIPPDQMKRLPPDVKLYPGLPVSTSIVTGSRSIMSYLMGPIKDAFSSSLHEE